MTNPEKSENEDFSVKLCLWFVKKNAIDKFGFIYLFTIAPVSGAKAACSGGFPPIFARSQKFEEVLRYLPILYGFRRTSDFGRGRPDFSPGQAGVAAGIGLNALYSGRLRRTAVGFQRLYGSLHL
ncbi:hypothetical protein V9W64_10700 [Neisseria leonii]|uniref:Uncharacterized protein n=1 Tax=Neisseria leonii TaxID=2995413 RepID=A0A9X4IF44_9NEIS|nr:hypothetical protein [Neisseria sp. 51.81]MDD9328798.1 hypothetical protein [Neisseria sp. 51.81]